MLLQALFNFLVYEELRERKEISKQLFGPYYRSNKEDLVTFQESVEMYLTHVEERRIKELYKHNNCTDQCKKRGCGSVWSTDGLWKLSYPIWYILFEAYGPGIEINCFSVSGGVADDLQSYIPMVCTNSPANGTHSTLSVCFVLNVYYRKGLLCVTLCKGGRTGLSDRSKRVSQKLQ